MKATFLPKVWNTSPGRTTFLRRLKEKAGLSGDFWAEDVRVWRYETEIMAVERPAMLDTAGRFEFLRARRVRRMHVHGCSWQVQRGQRAFRSTTLRSRWLRMYSFAASRRGANSPRRVGA